MKPILFLFLILSLLPLPGMAQEYDESYENYEDQMYIDEGDYNTEIYPPINDDYYLTEEMEMQEEPYPAEEAEWTLNGEELPVEEYTY